MTNATIVVVSADEPVLTVNIGDPTANMEEQLDQIMDFLSRRDLEYGSSWQLTSVTLFPLRNKIFDMFQKLPACLFNWILIFNKLLRCLADPRNIDHWKDMAGYALLIQKFLEENNAPD